MLTIYLLDLTKHLKALKQQPSNKLKMGTSTNAARRLSLGIFSLAFVAMSALAQNPSNKSAETKSDKPAKADANPRSRSKDGATNRIEVSDHVQPNEKTPTRKAANKDKAVQPKKQ